MLSDEALGFTVVLDFLSFFLFGLLFFALLFSLSFETEYVCSEIARHVMRLIRLDSTNKKKYLHQILSEISKTPPPLDVAQYNPPERSQKI